MNILKKIFFAFISTVIVTALALWILARLLRPDAIKDIINNQLYTITGQESHVDGEVVWHIFPRPGIKITQLHLGEKDNNGNYALYVEKLLINLQITPLFNGDLIFNELKMDGLSINNNPIIEKNSRINSSSPPLYPKNKPLQKGAPQFAIDHFLLTNGRISITKPQSKITLSDLQIEAKQFNLANNSFPLELKTNIIAAIADKTVKSTLRYHGHVALNSFTFTQPFVAVQSHAVLDGRLSMKSLSINQFKIAKVTANVKTKPGEITFIPFNTSLYNGKAVGDVSYKLDSKTLVINQRATGLDSTLLFMDLFSKTLVKGSLDFSIAATADLNNTQWQNTLRGNGNLSITEGALYFIDLNQFVDEAVSKIHSLLNQTTDNVKLVLQRPFFTPAPKTQGSTPFKSFTVQYQLLNGGLQSSLLELKADKIQLKGSGEVNFNTGIQALDLSAKLITTDADVNQIQQLVGGSFPVKVYGTITDPKILPNNQYINPIISAFLLKNTITQPVKQIGNEFKNVLSAPRSLIQDTLR